MKSKYFVEEINGGAERCNDAFIQKISNDFSVLKIKSRNLNPNIIKQSDAFFIIANFFELSQECKIALQDYKKYLIYEHDHKYLRTRDPSPFKDYLAPSAILCNVDFYKKAKAVVCQSQKHADILKSNF